jgi:hypothetical protein
LTMLLLLLLMMMMMIMRTTIACPLLAQVRPHLIRLTSAIAGLLLDVSRHFIEMDAVLALLPLCAAVKINVLHVHLTDDQGWRYESTALPQLNTEKTNEGKFYSQKQIEALVAAAHSYGVRVVPEVNFPAHTDTAFIAFPNLGSVQVSSINPKWGKHDSCTLPQTETWHFMDKLFKELSALFPDEYVHIGGDEADFCAAHVREWKEARMNDGAAFMKKTASIAKAYGKKAIIWDDTMGPELTGDQSGPDGAEVAVQWWHAPNELSSAVRDGGRPLIRSHRCYLNGAHLCYALVTVRCVICAAAGFSPHVSTAQRICQQRGHTLTHTRDYPRGRMCWAARQLFGQSLSTETTWNLVSGRGLERSQRLCGCPKIIGAQTPSSNVWPSLRIGFSATSGLDRGPAVLRARTSIGCCNLVGAEGIVRRCSAWRI